MSRWDAGLLSIEQRDYVAELLERPHLIADLSWDLALTRVLKVDSGGEHFVVKAAPPNNHHIHREITAHTTITTEVTSRGLTSRHVASSSGLNLIVLEYLPGELSQGTPAEYCPDFHRRAGAALRMIHDQGARVDETYQHRARARAHDWLNHEHRVHPHLVERARHILGTHEPEATTVVPTHGDWHPRNWLVDGTDLRVIDFGRFDWRPPSTDLCRLAAQQWRTEPALESAFIEGYGNDPRDGQSWRIYLLYEAIATAVWAYSVGDDAFERQGHRMLEEALALFSPA